MNDWDKIYSSSDNKLFIKKLLTYADSNKEIISNPYYVRLELKFDKNQVINNLDIEHIRSLILKSLPSNLVFNRFFNKVNVISIKLYETTTYRKKTNSIISSLDTGTKYIIIFKKWSVKPKSFSP